jgi:tetratricopeptide (TPR) repeat protein
VVAWLVAQVAVLTVDALFLPAWITRAVIVFAIVGFPIAIVLAWAYDITREGLKRTLPAGADRDLRGRGIPLVQRLAAGFIIAAVLVGGWAGWNRWSLGPPSISASTVAILPFNIRAGETFQYLGEGMASLIATKMGGVEEYRSVDPHAVLKFVERTGFRNIDPESARTVAEYFGAGVYVIGDVVELGDQLHFTVRIYESGRHEPATQLSVQGDANNLTVLVDQIVGLMLAAQFGEAETRLTTLAAMTTDSLDALKAYLEGEADLRAGKFEAAAEKFQLAVTIDPHFALAHYRLGITAVWIPNYGILEQAVQEALRNKDRLSPPDQILVEALHAAEASQPAKVRTLLRPYLETHPDDVEALYIYGEVLYNNNGLRGRSVIEAKEPFERLVDLDPDFLNIMADRLMAIAATEEDFETLDSLLLKVDPQSGSALYWGAVRAFAVGSPVDQAHALSQLREAADGPLTSAVYRLAGYSPGARGAERAARLLLDPHRSSYFTRFGRMFLFTVNLQRGHWQTAKAQIDSLKLIDPTRAARAFEFDGVYAAAPFLSVPEEDLRAVQSRLLQWDPAVVTDWTEGSAQSLGFHPLYREYLVGLVSLRLDDKRRASLSINALRDWQGESPEIDDLARFLVRRLEAHGARLEGRPEEALEALSAPPPRLPVGEVANSPVLAQPFELFLRAELLHELGRTDEARSWFQMLSEGVSWFNQPFAPVAHLRLAEIYDQDGAVEEAVHHYSRFIDYWRECDEPLQPLVETAEERLQALAPGTASRASP